MPASACRGKGDIRSFARRIPDRCSHSAEPAGHGKRQLLELDRQVDRHLLDAGRQGQGDRREVDNALDASSDQSIGRLLGPIGGHHQHAKPNAAIGHRRGQFIERLNPNALHDLADFVDTTADGRFVGVVEAAQGSAAALAESLTAMPFYRDVHVHPGVGAVSLYKRAQITAQDLAVAFGGDGPGRFDDLGDLTMFADNLVPHVLRVEGVLEFSPELLTRISAVDDITVGSPEEIEIRACGVHAVELLTTAVQTRSIDPRPTLTVGALDNILWNTGSDTRYKAIPRHRSRCVFY